MFKVSEENYSLRLYDETPKLFKIMLPDISVAAKFSKSQQKLHVLQLSHKKRKNSMETRSYC